jgi:hypothetical protein
MSNRPPLHIPPLKPAARQRKAMEKAHKAIFDLARIMPNHAGPNQEFTRFMVNLQAELRRGGYLLAGDGKGKFLPSAEDLASRRNNNQQETL